jgi:hypothetical protein
MSAAKESLGMKRLDRYDSTRRVVSSNENAFVEACVPSTLHLEIRVCAVCHIFTLQQRQKAQQSELASWSFGRVLDVALRSHFRRCGRSEVPFGRWSQDFWKPQELRSSYTYQHFTTITSFLERQSTVWSNRVLAAHFDCKLIAIPSAKLQHNGRQARPIPEQSGRFRLGHAHQLLQSRRQLHPRRRERRRMGVVLPHLEMGSHGMQLTLKFPVLKSKFIDGLGPAQTQLLQITSAVAES